MIKSLVKDNEIMAFHHYDRYTDALPLDGDGIAVAKSTGALLAEYCTIIKENAYSCDSRRNAPKIYV